MIIVDLIICFIHITILAGLTVAWPGSVEVVSGGIAPTAIKAAWSLPILQRVSGFK